MEYIQKIVSFFVVTILGGFAVITGNDQTLDKQEEIQLDSIQNISEVKMLKDVGEAYMDSFGLTEEDFKGMSEAGINTIEGNFDICAQDIDVKEFLDLSNKYNIKVVMPAGSGEAEWGYKCDQETYPITQKPTWDKVAVQQWVQKWKDHPAIYAWDTSNEAGSVFPNASLDKMLTMEQLQNAYKDVKEVDQQHPVMIRMNGWYFYDYEKDFFRQGNPFSNDVADIVMVNAYSNVEDYYPDFVSTVSSRAINSLQTADQDIKIIIALGAWEEKPLWQLPTEEHFKLDISQLDGLNLLGTAYFKYGAKGSEWYLPQQAPALYKVISETQ